MNQSEDGQAMPGPAVLWPSNKMGECSMVIDKPISENPPVIGPRLRAELERRVRELTHRLHPTHADRVELERLRELLEPRR